MRSVRGDMIQSPISSVVAHTVEGDAPAGRGEGRRELVLRQPWLSRARRAIDVHDPDVALARRTRSGAPLGDRIGAFIDPGTAGQATRVDPSAAMLQMSSGAAWSLVYTIREPSGRPFRERVEAVRRRQAEAIRPVCVHRPDVLDRSASDVVRDRGPVWRPGGPVSPAHGCRREARRLPPSASMTQMSQLDSSSTPHRE